MKKNQFVGTLLILIGIVLLITVLLLYFVSIFRNWWIWLILGIGIVLIIFGIIILMIPKFKIKFEIKDQCVNSMACEDLCYGYRK